LQRQIFTEGKKENEEVQKVVNKFFEFLFPQTKTLEAKGSENRHNKISAGAEREKTGCISAACAVRAALADSFCGVRRNREKRL
jgi:hypothetical protein